MDERRIFMDFASQRSADNLVFFIHDIEYFFLGICGECQRHAFSISVSRLKGNQTYRRTPSETRKLKFVIPPSSRSIESDRPCPCHKGHDSSVAMKSVIKCIL